MFPPIANSGKPLYQARVVQQNGSKIIFALSLIAILGGLFAYYYGKGGYIALGIGCGAGSIGLLYLYFRSKGSSEQSSVQPAAFPRQKPQIPATAPPTISEKKYPTSTCPSTSTTLVTHRVIFSPKLDAELAAYDDPEHERRISLRRFLRDIADKKIHPDAPFLAVPVLVYACKNGLVHTIEFLLKNGADPNISDGYREKLAKEKRKEFQVLKTAQSLTGWKRKSTSFHQLVDSRHSTENKKAIARLLIKHGADINQLNPVGYNPLSAAALNGDEEFFFFLLTECNADLHIKVVHILAAHAERFDWLHKVLQTFKKLAGEGYKKKVLDEQDAEGNTALHYAVMVGNARAVALLLSEGADKNLRNINGKIPLDLTKTISYLCKEAQELNSSDSLIISLLGNETPCEEKKGYREQYEIPSDQFFKEGIEKLERQEIAINTYLKGSTLLQWSIAYRDFDRAKKLINAGANVNCTVRSGFEQTSGDTPLMMAIRAGNRELVDLLIKKGAQVNAVNSRGETVAHIYALYGKDLGMDFRIFIGNEQSKNCEGETPLHYAARAGFLDFAKILIDRGADVNAKNTRGETPLNLAVQARKLECVNFLCVQPNCTIDEEDKFGNDPLHYAALSVYKEDALIVETILRRLEADGTLEAINDLNNEKLPPLYYACEAGNEAIVRLLLKYGALFDHVEVDAAARSGNRSLMFLFLD